MLRGKISDVLGADIRDLKCTHDSLSKWMQKRCICIPVYLCIERFLCTGIACGDVFVVRSGQDDINNGVLKG